MTSIKNYIMQTHNSLKELLEDFAIDYRGALSDDKKHLFDDEFIEHYLSSNSLALVKPEPLAKNKDCESKFRPCNCGLRTYITNNDVNCVCLLD